MLTFAEPRTCRDIGLQQCCDEDSVEEGGCIVYYDNGVTANNTNRSSAGHHNSYTPSSHELHLSGILYLRVWSPRLLSLLLNILYMLLSNCF